jgi:hypothetical protein
MKALGQSCTIKQFYHYIGLSGLLMLILATKKHPKNPTLVGH